MGIGGSIFLIAIGAIIAFGVNVQLGWLDLSVVGWVLMLAGFVGLILTLYWWNTRRREVAADQPVNVERQVVNNQAPPQVHTYRAPDPGVEVRETDWAQQRERRY